ncbi:unnamed protein product, partial [Mesorhabditis spiculigera]
MTPVRYYRVWIYSVNSLVIVFQTMMVWWIHGMFTHQWWQYIPFEEDHPTIIALEIQIGVQYFACIVGIMGVLFSNKSLLTIYWEDIGELFSEIVYSNHAKLYKHDEDDEDYCEPGTPERKILIA